MKYAIISDIHGNLEALDAVLGRAEAENPDKYICVGDIVGYNANPVECLERVQSLDLCSVVQGNNDSYVKGDIDFSDVNVSAKESLMWTRQQLNDSQKKWLMQLKLTDIMDSENITVVHSSLDSPSSWGYIYDMYHAEDNFLYQSTQVCFCGHTHVPVLFKKGFSIEKNTIDVLDVLDWRNISINEAEITASVDFGYKYLINPGSVGQPRNKDPRASFCIYDSEKRTLKRICVEYDIATAQEKILKAGLPEILAFRLAEGR